MGPLTRQYDAMAIRTSAEAAQSLDGDVRVVVGVDGSEYGARALEFAAHEAAPRGALLEVVSAWREGLRASRGRMPPHANHARNPSIH